MQQLALLEAVEVQRIYIQELGSASAYYFGEGAAGGGGVSAYAQTKSRADRSGGLSFSVGTS